MVEHIFDEDDLLYDEVDDQRLQTQKKRIRKKRKRRRMLLIILLAIFIGTTAYLLSDISKPKSLSVEGNIFYSDEEILSQAHISDQSRYIFIPKFYMQWQLEKNSDLEKVSIYKDLSGTIKITVKEKDIIGYFLNEKGENKIILASGEIRDLTPEKLSIITNYPQFIGFKEEEIKKIAMAFSHVEKLEDIQLISMISEIVPYQMSYDAQMIKMVMQDGNQIYTSLSDLGLMKGYNTMLQQLTGTHVCLLLDGSNDVFLQQNCESFSKGTKTESKK